jgi:methylenetetrahydrofolate reductase (NADPH)
MVDYVITRGEELTPKWQELTAEFDYPQPDGFYFFQKDPETGLNTSIQSPRIAQRENPPVYSVSRIIHKTVFNQHSPVFKTLLPLAEQVDKGPRMKRAFGKFEHLNKALLFDCMDCGDCALFDCAYICPMSQCPKGQRNGPCGGSFAGWCEVYPGQKRCIWVRIYLRLKKHRQETGALDYIVPPCDWELNQTSSWLNYYLGRDHTAKRLGIRPQSRLTAPATTEGKKTKNPK